MIALKSGAENMYASQKIEKKIQEIQETIMI